jgi:hypothetical protein
MAGLSEFLIKELASHITGDRDPLVVAISQVKAMLLRVSNLGKLIYFVQFRLKQLLKVAKAPY